MNQNDNIEKYNKVIEEGNNIKDEVEAGTLDPHANTHEQLR